MSSIVFEKGLWNEISSLNHVQRGRLQKHLKLSKFRKNIKVQMNSIYQVSSRTSTEEKLFIEQFLIEVSFLETIKG